MLYIIYTKGKYIQRRGRELYKHSYTQLHLYKNLLETSKTTVIAATGTSIVSTIYAFNKQTTTAGHVKCPENNMNCIHKHLHIHKHFKTCTQLNIKRQGRC